MGLANGTQRVATPEHAQKTRDVGTDMRDSVIDGLANGIQRVAMPELAQKKSEM